MKKVIMLAAACCMLALSASLVSCNPDKTQCWKLSVTSEDGKVTEHFFYGTGTEADAQLEVYHRAGATKVHREQTFLSEENCKNK